MTQWKQVTQFPLRTIFGRLMVRETGSVILIALIAWLSYFIALPLLLFPEFGALCNGAITRPQHIWARSPYHLAVMPALTGCLGVLALRLFGYGVLPVLLALMASLLLLGCFRSPIIPSLSSGLIPLVLHIPSWTYPLSVFLSCTILAIIIYFRGQRLKIPRQDNQPFRLLNGGWPRNAYHLAVFLGFIAGITLISEVCHQPIILFPPLAVLGFEILLHSGRHPWCRWPALLPLIFFVCAGGGFVSLALFGHSVCGVIIAVTIAICVTFYRGLYIPPAIAVSLLPFVMQHVGFTFPFDIAFSVAALVIVAIAREWLDKQITRASLGRAYFPLTRSRNSSSS